MCAVALVFTLLRACLAGGTDRYEDRGLIPRTLTYLFDWIAKHSELSVTLRISYLEIYNDKG